MKKSELMKTIDRDWLEKLFGFCYARTKDSYEAEELCSDVVFALMKASKTDGEIENPNAFIWRVARNVYADFSDKKKRKSEKDCSGDSVELLSYSVDPFSEDDDRDSLKSIYRQISFLTKAYRDVMIMFYLDGLSTAEIAKRTDASETAVRQRLFSARERIKSEVNEMNIINKPTALNKIDYVFWGTGKPSWGDPRSVCTRQMSKHIVWLCRNKAMSASVIAEELNVPTMYIEEELEILAKGTNGEYGLLKKLPNGKYIINFVLFDKTTMDMANRIYTDKMDEISDIIVKFIDEHKNEYLSFPYLNKKFDLNLILWQQVALLSHTLANCVEKKLKSSFFAEYDEPDRPFTVFAYEDNGKYYGGGWDGAEAHNVCGYSNIKIDNIYTTRIARHFSCTEVNIANDDQIQLAVKAIDGIDIDTLSEADKEHAAKAIESGYIYRDGDKLFTKILVSDGKDNVFAVSETLKDGCFDEMAEKLAAEAAKFIRRNVPEHLFSEWKFANMLAAMPIEDALIEALIEKGLLIPPENGLGAEGCWMNVSK